ncbi:MAG: ArsC family reductase [Porticoccaceae bacterium]
MKLYGIKNCDTVKKARAWLDQHGLTYDFHDFRQDGLDETMIHRWQTSVALDTLLNRRGTTWRNLDSDIRENLVEAEIPALLAAHPTLVKRPVLERGSEVVVGFSDKVYSTFFNI